MTEELENIDEQLEDTTPAEGVKTEKQYSEKDVQRVVQERVKREKENSRKQKEEFDSKETEYQESISKLESILQKQVESLSKDLPESTKKLLSKLSVLEQLDWLSEEGNTQKKSIPTTPKPDETKTKIDTKKIGKLF